MVARESKVSHRTRNKNTYEGFKTDLNEVGASSFLNGDRQQVRNPLSRLNAAEASVILFFELLSFKDSYC